MDQSLIDQLIGQKYEISEEIHIQRIDYNSYDDTIEDVDSSTSIESQRVYTYTANRTTESKGEGYLALILLVNCKYYIKFYCIN